MINTNLDVVNREAVGNRRLNCGSSFSPIQTVEGGCRLCLSVRENHIIGTCKKN